MKNCITVFTQEYMAHVSDFTFCGEKQTLFFGGAGFVNVSWQNVDKIEGYEYFWNTVKALYHKDPFTLTAAWVLI